VASEDSVRNRSPRYSKQHLTTASLMKSGNQFLETASNTGVLYLQIPGSTRGVSC